MAPESAYPPASPTRPYASKPHEPQSPTARRSSLTTYDNTGEEEGVVGLGLGLGAAENEKDKPVCHASPKRIGEMRGWDR